MKNSARNGAFIAPGRKLWTHELKVAEILAQNGYSVVFLQENQLHTADVILNGVEFEIKSPRSSKANSLEHILKKALKQSNNIIIDTSRIKGANEEQLKNFFITQAKHRKRIKKLMIITKRGQVIDLTKQI